MSVEQLDGLIELKGIEFQPELERKGRELLKAGHIFNVSEIQKKDKKTVVGSCLRQGKGSNAPYIIILQVNSDRSIESALCICQSGSDGLCKHTSALFQFINEERPEPPTPGTPQNLLKPTPIWNGESPSDIRAHALSVIDSTTDVYDARDYGSIAEFVQSKIENRSVHGSFLVCNLSTLGFQYQLWRNELPMVDPFYAVKCNPDPTILRVLASLGCGFDCATMGELDLVLNGLGEALSFGGKLNATNDIVYANPAKMEHMIDFAIRNGVQMTVFDGEDELYKISKLKGCNKLKLLLRVTTDDKDSVCRFSKKFGCPVEEANALLVVAKKLGLHVAGVSFHVGSGCGAAYAYTKALQDARDVFKMAESLGMTPMTIVDIGGGFPGDDTIYGADRLPNFQQLAKAIREGISDLLESLQRPASEIRFIAEPGRFFVSASTCIVTKVYARKGGRNNFQALYVDDGVYGSFNNVVYDHALPLPKRVQSLAEYQRNLRSGGAIVSDENNNLIPTAVFGPTCDGLDQMCSLENTLLERCSIGDWLIWENQGAYTHTASYVFNGYTHIPSKIYCTL